MLIKPDVVRRYLTKPVKGVLHIGAHECEERPFYHWLGVSDASMVWIDAMESKVQEAARRRIPNVYQAVVTDTDDATVEFHITNNVQSSSVLEFGSHAHHHPHVVFTGKQTLPTVTIDTFLERHKLDPSRYTFWNLDIQGAELMALRGGTNAFNTALLYFFD